MISESTQITTDGLDKSLLSLVRQVESIPVKQPVPESLRKRFLKHLGLITPLEVTILISGIQPGTGSSTLKRLLCRVLGYPDNPDAGFYRRAIAHHWAETLKNSTGPIPNSENYENWESMQWVRFEAFVRNQFELYVDFLQAEINPQILRDDELIPFNEAQVRHSTDSDFWERLPDTIVRDQIRGIRSKGQDGYDIGIWQGKFTAVVDWIIGSELEAPENSKFAYPLIRVLLTIDPVVAAERVAAREGWSVEKAFQENAARSNRDQAVLQKTYGQDMTIFDDPRILSLDTTHMSPAEETTIILSLLSKRKRD